VKLSVADVAGVIQEDGDLGMAFDSRDRFDV
jgi:hypothetical protein